MLVNSSIGFIKVTRSANGRPLWRGDQPASPRANQRWRERGIENDPTFDQRPLVRWATGSRFALHRVRIHCFGIHLYSFPGWWPRSQVVGDVSCRPALRCWLTRSRTVRRPSPRFQMLESLRDQFPDEDPVHLAAISDVWSIEGTKVIDRMFKITHERGIRALPLQARPEAIFELAKLIHWLEGQIIKTKTAQTPIQAIDAEAERDALGTPLIQDRIENTAVVLAEHIWVPLCTQWWKRFSRIKHERPKSVRSIARKQTPGTRRHYSPAFSNKHWALKNRVRVYSLGLDDAVRSDDVPAKSWGREPFLYSQELEDWLGLVEGDAGKPYKKLLEGIPLSEGETRQWVAYLAVQRFRTPGFILRLLPKLARSVSERGLDSPTDTASLRSAFERMLSSDKVFADMYQRLVGHCWEMWRTLPEPGFIRSDEPVLVSSGGGGRLVPHLPDDSDPLLCRRTRPGGDAAERGTPLAHHKCASTVQTEPSVGSLVTPQRDRKASDR